MSYDLMVFEPSAPPPDRDGFMAWYREQTRWSEDHGYNNPDVCTPTLRAWFDDMRKIFAPMNGPLRSEDHDDPKRSDYSIGRKIIYCAFNWAEAEDAYVVTLGLARKHNIGFFDVSSNDGAVFAPNGNGEFVILHGANTGPEEPVAIFESILEKRRKGIFK